jgi:LacI family transcriptional regulator
MADNGANSGRVVPNSPRRSVPRPVMREVAERAGVAMSSVSRVLSGHPDVSPLMRNRVLDAVAALNFQPDRLAQSLRTGETKTVGFLVADISNPLMSQIALGAEVQMRKAGYAMLLTNSFNETDLDVAHMQLLQQRRVDGLLLSLSEETDPQVNEVLDRLDVPAVLVDRQILGSSFASVVSDHASGIEDAVALLAGLGHQRIGLVNDNRNVRPSRERANALRRACRNIPGLRGTVRSVALSPEHGYQATKDLLAGDDAPTALIAGGNQTLVGVLLAIRELGLSFPEDVSLVTCDDFPFSDYLAITTISRDSREIGRVAARLLLEEIGGKPARRVVLPTALRITDSCAPPATRRARGR